MKKPSLAILCVFATLGLGAGVLASGLEGPSPIMLPPGSSSVKDVHASHRDGRADCASCHPKASRSRWASDRLIPDMADCGPCHPEVKGVSVFSKTDLRCGKCHDGVSTDQAPPVRGEYPRPNIRFSHESHKISKCSDCHLAAGGQGSAGPGMDVVGMKVCYSCHEKSLRASTKCRTCHLVHPDGRMITQLDGVLLVPPSWLVGETHGENWVMSHASRAGSDSDFCGSCHREKFCQDCHTGRLRPRNVHPGDWMASHGVSTRMGNPNCMGCHRTQTFCITCHRRTGVAPDSPRRTKPANSGNFHRGQSPERICRRARYDIAACVSCHSESSCIQCHMAINPHPAGWSRRCRPLARKNQQACVKCHRGSIWKRCE